MMSGKTKSPGVSQKTAAGFQKTDDRSRFSMGGSSHVKKKGKAGSGSTRGGPSQKVKTRIQT